MAQRTTVNRRTTTYRAEVQGNVVRQFQAVPNRPEKVNGPVEVPRRSRKSERSTLSIPYCIFLAVACVLTLSLGAYYLEQQALATSSQKKIASLESELAELKKVNAENTRQIKANSDFYMLKKTEVPTIIVECGFLSNPGEAEKLVSEEYQEQMAQAICSGIMTWLARD